MLDVQLVTLELEQRLNSLEENSNSSIDQLEVRVGTLEAAAADHESRLTAVESEIEGRFYFFHSEILPTPCCNFVVTNRTESRT